MSEKIRLKTGDIVENRYTIISLIGQGGFGKTYLAEDKTTGSHVALKVLYFSEIENWKKLELFEREISVLQNLDHKFIPNYIDSFETKLDNETLFILVQNYVKGNNLYDYIKSGKKISLEKAISIFEKLLKILKYIHGLNPAIIHRDINPKNIILDENDDVYVYLVDFGAVGHIVATTIAAARSDTFVGTLGYMPPEQLFGKVTKASDIYSLGVTLLFILTGKEPHEFEMIKLQLDYYSFVSIPEYLNVILDLMLDPEPEDRIADAEEILKLLKNKKIEKKEEKKESEEKNKKAIQYSNISKKNYKTVIKNIPEPNRSLSIKTRITTNRFGFYGKLILAAGIFLMLFLIGTRFLASYKLNRVDAKTMGTVVMRRSTATKVSGKRIYKVYFRFTHNDKEYFQYSFSRDSNLKKGSWAEIEYIKENPAFSRIAGASYNFFGKVFPIIILLIFFVAGTVLYALGIALGKRKLLILYKKGVIKNSGILNKEKTGHDEIVYSYSFTNKNEERIQATYISENNLGNKGSLVPIIYNPRTNYSKIIELDDVLKIMDERSEKKIVAYYFGYATVIMAFISLITVNYNAWVKGSYLLIEDSKKKNNRHSIKNKKYKNALINAINKKDSIQANRLIEKGTNLNVKDFAGRTPLIWAIMRGMNETAKLLIQKGVDINAEDIRGNSAVHYAVSTKNTQAIDILIKNKAKINKKNNAGNAPLYYAMIAKDWCDVTTSILIKYGADLNITDNKGRTPLLWAITRRMNDVLKKIIRKKLNLNITDIYGNTALHYAAWVQNTGAVKILLQHKVNVNAKNNTGQTPLRYAKRRKNQYIEKLLVNAGAKE